MNITIITLEKLLSNSKLQNIVLSLSLANLCLLSVWRELIYATDVDKYWIPTYTTSTYIASLINLLVISIFIFVILQYLFTSQSVVLRNFGLVLLLLILVLPINYIRISLDINERTIHAYMENIWTSALGTAIVGFTFIYLYFFKLHTILKLIRIVGFLLTPFLIIILIQACWNILTVDNTQSNFDAATVPPIESQKHQRVIWIVFDELDGRLIRQERPTAIDLPEFDRLRSQSIDAKSALSFSLNTLQAIPSYLSGNIVQKARPVGPDRLALVFAPVESPIPATHLDTENVFADAKRRSARNAIIGYYHPYCRLFSANVQFCRDYFVNTFSPHATNDIVHEMWSQLMGITPFFRRINAIETFLHAREHAKRLAAEANVDLFFFHASVPHGPNIWNLREKEFTLFNVSKNGYFENFALADRLLGEIRKSMEKANLWENAAVIVTSDHEWRHTYLYDNKRAKTIPFIVKMPNQIEGIEFRKPFSPMHITRRLVVDILTRKLRTPSDVISRMEENAAVLAEKGR